ncbi:hypothetical protein H257_12727 [Aphanomyces astaci]|uniref:O-GlcNAc transferase C-terminal domain-containing protein n=1 Tax=Aphanomyces astaci TaxID=112090 RepID=W4FZQ9_APHAT|nr:hypothetical protein H257_12727 [Aphanomyces astaci]ETV72264.1 hypothetical protein H257_12727 [Aphanomyces astaci]|eukprot:XP_009838332.1 hypothetical protein H257_12727 [Aphanomyces astaci]
MGFHGSMGAEYMQYIVADKIVLPVDVAAVGYTEKVLYMPQSFFVNDHKQSALSVLDVDSISPSRSTYGLPEDQFVFCNFSQLYKLDPAMFGTWMHILKRVPNSVLWLLRYHHNELVETNLKAEAKAHGIRETRLHFTAVAPKEEHLKRGYLADLFLDTATSNGHTIGCDILWSGTPMITQTGHHMASRVASSLLLAVDLPELIADTLEEYEELAVALALDMDKLWELRKKLEASRTTCPLFDTTRWVRNWETAMLLAWSGHDGGMPLDHIDVPDIEDLVAC